MRWPILIVLLAGSLRAEDWSDTFLGYRWGTQFRDPGIASPIRKDILQVTHAGSAAWGRAFLNVDMLQSDLHDPAAGGGAGAMEFYATLRTTLDLGLGTPSAHLLPGVQDLGLTLGLDLNSKNTAFASRKRLWVLGPTFRLAVPRGFLDVSFLASRERTHNGIVGRDVAFSTTWMLSAAWGIPFEGAGTGWTIKGFANHVGPKGRDGFNVETRAETLAQVALLPDVGRWVGLKPGRLMAGLGYQHWNNKFGTPNRNAQPGINRPVNALMGVLEWHF